MLIQFKNYHVKSYEHGYMLSKLKGKRFLPLSYHATLKSAVSELIDRRVRVETVGDVINAVDRARSRSKPDRLIRKIDGIAAEVLEGINHEL